MGADKKEVFQALAKLLNTQDLDKWAAEKSKPMIDEVIALIKRAIQDNKEKLLVYDELQNPFFINQPNEEIDEYIRSIRWKGANLDNICLLQVLLPAWKVPEKKLPSYEQATDKAIQKAEVLVKKISKATNCNAETAGYLAGLLVQGICHMTYYIYNNALYSKFTNQSTEIATKVEAVLRQITEPVKDKKNDIYYNERDRLMADLNKIMNDLFASMYNYNKADRIAAGIVSRLYPEQETEQSITITAKRDNRLYFPIPSTSLTKITKQILNNPNRPQTTKRGQIKQTEHLLTGDSMITYKGNDSTVTFTLESKKELFAKKIQNGVKVFNFFLQKLNEQHRQETTNFQLTELVENGAYANKDSAYRGIKNILNKMYAISIEGTVTEYKGRKKQEKAFAKSRIISSYQVSYKKCYVNLTPIIRENMPYITLLPKWSYKLNENGYMLLDYISILARQNAEQIKRAGCFNIGLETVRAYMGLPTPEEAGDDPKRLIFEPIEKAITEIEEKQEGTAFKITPSYDTEYKNIHSYLAGYLKIELDQPMQDSLTLIANMQEKEYKLEQKRIEKAKQKAVESTIKQG